MQPLEIDGSYGSGSGTIIRLAAALSTITKKPIRVKNIRAKRCTQGLAIQHLHALQSIAELCNATLKGDFLHSKEIEFYPGEIQKTKLKIDLETSASIGLVLYPIILASSLSKEHLEIEIKGGGTLGKFSPNLLYTENILLPTLRKINIKAKLEIKKHGFYPKGGADIIFYKEPSKEIYPLKLEKREQIKQINCISIASADLKKAEVAERQFSEAKKLLSEYTPVPFKTQANYYETYSTGSGILLWADYNNCLIASDALGERGKKSEQVGSEAAQSLISQLKTDATVDEFLSDQILPFLALSKESSIIKIPKLTEHVQTNIWLIKQFLNTEFKVYDDTIEIIPDKNKKFL